MQLETFISDLLYRYECVTIPEFGSFLSRHVSASIDDSSNTFFPPKKVLSFNEQIQKNDGLLAHYIADVEKIPFEVANQKIAKRVKILKSYLMQGETLTFKNIGEIVFNKEGKILFEPTYQLNYLTDAFGLEKFESLTVTRETYKETANAVEKVVPIALTPEKRKSRNYLKYAAVALIALTVGGFAASNYYVNQIELHNKLAKEEADLELDSRIQKATFSLNVLPAIKLNVTKQTGNYHIVAGAFRVKENSEKIVEQLKSIGYPARILGLNRYGLYEVVYSSHETGKEALTAVREIRKTQNKDAWIKVESTKTEPKKVSNTTVSSVEKPSEIQKIGSEVTMKTSKEVIVDKSVSDTSKMPNIIKIVNDIESIESGYYVVVGDYLSPEKRDAALSELVADGLDLNYVYDSKTGKFIIYFEEKFNDLESANRSMLAKLNLSKNQNLAVIKIED